MATLHLLLLVLVLALVLVLLLLFSGPAVFLLTTQNKSRRTPRRPPGPKGLPLIGNLHQLDISKPHIWLAKQSNKYGPIMLVKVCRLPVMVFSSAQAAKDIYEHNDIAFAGRPYSSGWFRLSYGQCDIIGSPYTDYWRQMRKIVAHHLLGPPKTRSFRPIREDEVSRMISDIWRKANSDEVIDIGETALSFTCNVLCRVAFGKKFDEGATSWRLFERTMNQFMVSIFQTFLAENLLFGWINKLSGANARVEEVFKEMDSFYQQLIDENLSSNDNLLHLLIQLREDDSAPLNIDWNHIKAVLMNVFLAGIETNGVTITWALTALIKNPSAMKRVQEEIRSVVGIKSSVHEADIGKLPYLKAVIKETLRLFPPVPLVPKETTATSTINGYEIDPKTVVVVNIWAIGRDPEHWENPQEFFPERFLNTNIDDFFGFIPFGFGRRVCPGKNLALTTIELALPNILYFFSWELPHGITQEDIDTHQTFGLVMHKKNPLYLLPKPYL